MRGVWLEQSKTYGTIELLDYSYKIYESGGQQHNHKYWHCRCTKCGSEFQANGQAVLKMMQTGCTKCKRIARDQQQDESVKSYIGSRFGRLEVVGYAGLKPIDKNGRLYPVMECKCLNCGSVTEIPLVKLKQGGAKQCWYCSQANLETGRKIVKSAASGGSSVLGCSPTRALNKNSTTGVKGVSKMKTGKYRAYITFRRKQYSLGCYTNLEDAAAARKKGEEQIHGDFLRWYAAAHPEEWERLCQIKPELRSALKTK